MADGVTKPMPENANLEHVQVEPWMLEAATSFLKDLAIYSEGTLDRLAHEIARGCPRITVSSFSKDAGNGKMPCPKCGHQVDVTIRQAIPFNSGSVSSLMIVHKPARCEGCGREYVPFVTGGNLQCAVAEIQPESSIVLPGAGSGLVHS